MKITLKDTGLRSTYQKDFDAEFPIAFGKFVNIVAYYSSTDGLPARFYLRGYLHGDYVNFKEITRMEFADYIRIYLDQTLWIGQR